MSCIFVREGGINALFHFLLHGIFGGKCRQVTNLAPTNGHNFCVVELIPHTGIFTGGINPIMYGLNILVPDGLSNIGSLTVFGGRRALLLIYLFGDDPCIIRKLREALVLIIAFFKNATTTVIDLEILFTTWNRAKITDTRDEILWHIFRIADIPAIA